MQSLAPDDIGFDDLAVKEEKEEMEFDRDEEDRNAEERDASPGTSVLEYLARPPTLLRFPLLLRLRSSLPPQPSPRSSTTTSQVPSTNLGIYP